MVDVQAINAATDTLISQGVRVFNGALFGADEEAHVSLLLAVMDPPPGAKIIDAGCGVGEMAKIMHALRPDLDFTLVNISQAQLDHCPGTFKRVCADFDSLPAEDASVDVVIFSYAICHSANWPRTLREARRVLKVGGVLFINDMTRLAGDNDEFECVLGARVHEPENIEAWARAAGFSLDSAIAPAVQIERLRPLLDGEVADRVLADVVPTIWRFTALEPVASAFARHERIGFQFSGGRDSTAALYLLRPYWDRMTIYHLDTGDQFPETREVVRQVERDLAAAGARIERIVTDVQAQRAQFGYPSDLVPVDNLEVGRMVSGRKLKLQGRYDCCSRSLMSPMHGRILADGVTLIVRGQRDDEYAAPPMRSGDVAGSLEVLYPIQSWTGAQVSSYLTANHLPIAAFYERGARRAPECMGCTAWWDEGRAGYLRQHHPAEHAVLIRRMSGIKEEISQQLNWLNMEMEA